MSSYPRRRVSSTPRLIDFITGVSIRIPAFTNEAQYIGLTADAAVLDGTAAYRPVDHLPKLFCCLLRLRRRWRLRERRQHTNLPLPILANIKRCPDNRQVQRIAFLTLPSNASFAGE